MNTTQRVAAAGLAGALAVGGLGAATLSGAFATPAPVTSVVQAQDDTDTSDTSCDRSGMPWGGERHGNGPGQARMLSEAAAALGLTESELREALSEDGQSLADVASEQGVEPDELVDELVAAATARVEDAVTDGRLSREDADEHLADLPERIAAMVEQDGPRFDRDRDGSPWGGGPGGDRPGGHHRGGGHGPMWGADGSAG